MVSGHADPRGQSFARGRTRNPSNRLQYGEHCGVLLNVLHRVCRTQARACIIWHAHWIVQSGLSRQSEELDGSCCNMHQSLCHRKSAGIKLVHEHHMLAGAAQWAPGWSSSSDPRPTACSPMIR
jgi:hypothetical protein